MRVIIAVFLMMFLLSVSAVERLITEASGYQVGYVYCFYEGKDKTIMKRFLMNNGNARDTIRQFKKNINE